MSFSIDLPNAGNLQADVHAAYADLDEKQSGKRLFAHDATLWKTEPELVKAISNRLGWLTLPDTFKQKAEELIAFSEQIKNEGYQFAVLLGMGGSSLCSEVARETYGSSKGYPQLLVLDNTSPEAIKDLEKQINIEKTLFIVASKSGGTKETLCFFYYFYDRLKQMAKEKTGNSFVAITDPGTPLVKIAETYKFRKVFLNPPDIGGRYSVLSGFGMLPMALMGIDVKAFMDSAGQMEESCRQPEPTGANPGLSLGAALGVCQRSGRDKVTFILSSSIRSFGLWVEQLIAESTGKEGRGLIPVEGERPGAPGMYSADRVFVHMCIDADNNEEDEKRVMQLEQAGHPVVRIKLPDTIALGGEYYRWEVATAISGTVMSLNPFDEPNVAESKKNTENLLEDWKLKRSFKQARPILQVDDIAVFGSENANKLLPGSGGSPGDIISRFAELGRPGDYIAFLPYFMLSDSRMEVLQSWRHQVRDKLKVATTLLNGPRYLHSTGQLHKGGPATGLYVMLMGEEIDKLPIPGETYDFSVLHQAQALGDFRSLDSKGRRVLYITLGRNIDDSLARLWKSVTEAEQKEQKAREA